MNLLKFLIVIYFCILLMDCWALLNQLFLMISSLSSYWNTPSAHRLLNCESEAPFANKMLTPVETIQKPIQLLLSGKGESVLPHLFVFKKKSWIQNFM